MTIKGFQIVIPQESDRAQAINRNGKPSEALQSKLGCKFTQKLLLAEDTYTQAVMCIMPCYNCSHLLRVCDGISCKKGHLICQGCFRKAPKRAGETKECPTCNDSFREVFANSYAEIKELWPGAGDDIK